MKKDSIIDYAACILFRILGPVIRILPVDFSFFLGRRLGDLFYCFDLKHKAVIYANLKTAFGNKLSPLELSHLAKDFYRAFGQNFIEIFMIPLVNREYMRKYICLEGLNFIDEGFKRGKGVILLGVHEGSWELASVISANLGFPFVLFVRDLRYPRLNQLLNSYRSQKGCKIIPRVQTRQLIERLKNNQAIAMTLDQGGKGGIKVRFFGKDASWACGAVRLALKYDATIIPAFFTRLTGPHIKIIIEPSFKVEKTGDFRKDVSDNLQALVHIFERHISKYLKEYLWSYKIWKYTKEQKILILDDGKTGHFRQAQALAKIASNYLKDKGISTNTDTIEVKFKNKFAKTALTFCCGLAGKYHCQGCLWCLKTNLKKDVYETLVSQKPDVIISCGSSVAPINYVLSRENLAKSIVIMRPSILSIRRFDLVIMPRHDKPPKRKNVVAIEGALNLIDDKYLKEQSDRLIKASGLRLHWLSGFYIGLLIGGDSKNFHLDKEVVSEVVKQVKLVAKEFNAEILLTTSRRTSQEAEKLLKQELKDYLRCKLLIIANEKNIPEAVGGILGLSKIVIVSPESISMISEAASSGKYVLVFTSRGLSIKHQRFLDYFAKNKYIYLTKANELSKMMENILLEKPRINFLKDNLKISKALSRIL